MSKNYINKTGKHWYNNGVTQVQALECPEGFVAGRLPIADETKKKISKSLIGHPSSCKGVPKSEETKGKISETRKERKIQVWNKGLTAETDDRVARNGQAIKETRTERGNYVAWNKGLTKDTDYRVLLNWERTSITIFERYGVTNATYIDGVSEKKYNTNKRNGTFHVSHPENHLYSLLCDAFSCDDVVRQYKEIRYPYSCDFYIKSLDLFIELNLHWTHGGKPFDPDDEECQKKLAFWKEKSKTSSYYRNAIHVWTIMDINKVNTAHKNNLNLIVLYEDNFDELISGIKEKSLMVKTS